MAELDFLDDWELVRENDEVVTILCKLCKEEGKEQRPIKSNAKDKMMSLGEQHRFFRHQRAPIGYPIEAEFYSLQCATCKWYFPVKRILESHEKTCTGVEGRLAVSKSSGSKEKNNNRAMNGDATNGDATSEEVEKKPDISALSKSPAKPVAPKVGRPSTRPRAAGADGAAVTKPLADVVPKTEPTDLSANLKDTLTEHGVLPCKVMIPRTAAAEELVKKRKLDGIDKENEAPLKKRKIESGLPVDVLSLGNKWWEEEPLEGGFACPLCKTRPLSKPVFIEDHVAAHHFKQRRFICALCRDEEKEPFTWSWSHKSTLEEHLKKNHPKEFRASDKAGEELTEVIPLLPEVVNVMRLFFKTNPKKGEEVKEPYQPKKPHVASAEDNTKKSQCPECEQKFYSRDPRTIIDHIMWFHREAPRYHCALCDDIPGFGMVAGFEDHCKKKHGCDKVDHLRMLFMKVDRVPEDLLDKFNVGKTEIVQMHEEQVVIGEDEVDEIDQVDVSITASDVKLEMEADDENVNVLDDEEDDDEDEDEADEEEPDEDEDEADKDEADEDEADEDEADEDDDDYSD